MSYILSNDNRYYVALEQAYGTAAAVVSGNRIPAVKLTIKQQAEKIQRQDKTGSNAHCPISGTRLPAGGSTRRDLCFGEVRKMGVVQLRQSRRGKVTLYLVFFELQSDRNPASFFEELHRLGAKEAFPSVWFFHGTRAPGSTAEVYRNVLRPHIDESSDCMLVMGIESTLNLAGAGDCTKLREVFNLAVN